MIPERPTPCACGCGQILLSLGSNGMREYLPGHNPIPDHSRASDALAVFPVGEITLRETERFRYLSQEVARGKISSSPAEFKFLADRFASRLERQIRARSRVRQRAS